MPATSLTPTELEKGWVVWICGDHGFLVACSPATTVKCGCGKAAYAERQGRRLNNRDRKALQFASSRSQGITESPGKRPRGRPFVSKVSDPENVDLRKAA